MSQTACAMESVREEAQPEQKMWARHQGSTPRVLPRVPSSPPSQNLQTRTMPERVRGSTRSL